jgi:hypothetical protein
MLQTRDRRSESFDVGLLINLRIRSTLRNHVGFILGSGSIISRYMWDQVIVNYVQGEMHWLDRYIQDVEMQVGTQAGGCNMII